MMTNDNRPKILILDDDRNLSGTLKTILETEGFSAEVAASGEEAVHRVRQNNFDVALIDVHLSGMSGMQALREIRIVSPGTECILLTGYASQETAIEAINLGAYAYFQKPYDIDQLLLSIRRALDKKRAEQALRQSEERYFQASKLMADYIYELEVTADGEMRRTWITESFTRITGYTPEEMDASGGWPALIYPEDLHISVEQARKLLANQMDFQELRIIRKDGQVRWLQDYSKPVWDDEQKRVVRVIGATRDITERKNILAALEETKGSLEALINSVNESILLIKPDGTVLAANQTSALRMNADRQGLIGKNIYDHVDAEAAQYRQSFTRQVIETGKPVQFTDQRFGRWIDNTFYPVFDAEGKVNRLAIFGVDITERRAAQEEIRSQSERLAGIYEAAPMGIGVSKDRIPLDVNEGFCRLTGYSRDELIGHSTRILYATQAEFDRVGENRNLQLQAVGFFEIETQFKRKDGQLVDILLRVSPLDKNDLAKGNVFVALDITASKKAERENRQQAEKITTIYRAAPIGIGIGRGRVLMDFNDAFCAMTGYSREELTGQSTRMLYRSDEDFEQAGANRRNRLQTEGMDILETQLRRKDGEMIDVIIRSSVMDPKNPQLGSVFTVVDITSQKNTERNLRESEQRFSLAFDTSPYAITITRPEDGSFLSVNPALSTISGYSREEALAGSSISLALWADPADRQAVVQRLRKGEKIVSEEFHFRRKNGETFFGLFSADVLVINGENYILSSINDINDRVQRERELKTVARISAAMRVAEKREDIIRTLMEELIVELEVDGATIEILEAESGDLIIEQGSGVWSRVSGRRIPAGEGMSAEVLKSKKPFLNNNAFADERLMYPETFGDCRAAAGAPLIVQENVIGLIWVGSRRKLTEGDVHVLAAVADMAANAIQRASLHEQSLRRIDELNTLRTIDQAINTSFDLRVTLDVIVKQARSLADADAVAVLVYNPTSLMLKYAAGTGFKTGEMQKAEVRIGSGGAGSVALERKPLLKTDMRLSKSECVRKEIIEAEGLIAYHAFPLIVKSEIKGVLEIYHRAPFTPDAEWLGDMESVATQTATAVDNSQMFYSMQKMTSDLIVAYDETIEGWAAALELRDHETEGHSRRVTEHLLRMARELNFKQEEIAHLMRGALLHDIGKISIPDAVLRKPGPLDEGEWKLMKTHPKVAYDLLSGIRYLKSALDIPYCHHENWDGTGYPRGLKGDQIPLSARLFSVVDVYDALTSDRPYRKAWKKEDALKHIQAQAGKQFDPQAVELFLKTIEE